MKTINLLTTAVLFLSSWLSGSATSLSAREAPRPPSNPQVVDQPNDAGTALQLSWTLSPDDKKTADPRIVVGYEIYRKDVMKGKFELIGESLYQQSIFIDTNCKPDDAYFYEVRTVGRKGDLSEPVGTTKAVSPVVQYFDMRRIWFGLLLLIVCSTTIYMIEMARKGWDLKVRKIAGLEAVEEAVGRATEMGQACLFVPGIQDINDIQTVTGLTILSRVANLIADYDADLHVPTARALVMTAGRETVEAAYLEANRHDAYNENDIYYLTDDQFGYVAGVTGTMLRDKPAACFFMGAFYAESLLLAETGNSIGAIQVAGTAMPSQLPFFVAACDYTLIGEEFFAASAYLSGEPHQLGSLKAQDISKLIGAAFIVFGCVLATIVVYYPDPNLAGLLDYIKNNILGSKGLTP